MLVAAFDPGDSTGFAVVDETSAARFSGMFPLDAVDFYVRTIAKNFHITHIIMEAPPFKILTSQQAWNILEKELHNTFPLAIYEIKPGLWKPLRHNFVRADDRFGSDHEKDAVHLGRYRVRQLHAQKVKA